MRAGCARGRRSRCGLWVGSGGDRRRMAGRESAHHHCQAADKEPVHRRCGMCAPHSVPHSEAARHTGLCRVTPVIQTPLRHARVGTSGSASRAIALPQRRPAKVVAVALANKVARIAGPCSPEKSRMDQRRSPELPDGGRTFSAPEWVGVAEEVMTSGSNRFGQIRQVFHASRARRTVWNPIRESRRGQMG